MSACANYQTVRHLVCELDLDQIKSTQTRILAGNLRYLKEEIRIKTVG